MSGTRWNCLSVCLCEAKMNETLTERERKRETYCCCYCCCCWCWCWCCWCFCRLFWHLTKNNARCNRNPNTNNSLQIRPCSVLFISTGLRSHALGSCFFSSFSFCSVHSSLYCNEWCRKWMFHSITGLLIRVRVVRECKWRTLRCRQIYCLECYLNKWSCVSSLVSVAP